MSSYDSGFSLGPHEPEHFSEPSAPLLRRAAKAARESLSHPHFVPSALILVALLSFAGNLAFTYGVFVRKGIDPEIAPPAALTTSFEQLGSDDNSESVAPHFTSSFHYKFIDDAARPKLSAESYLVADAETGEIIIEKAADTPYPMASISKLLTAIVSKEEIDSRHPAVVSKDSYNTYGSEGGLSAGEKILVSDLYYPLLIESSNDAAEVLADDYGREEFMFLLNEKAASLGMYSTFYDDPSGLSPKNVTTSHDLTKLGMYVYAQYPEILDITRVKGHSILGHAWANKNKMLNYPNFLGGKNGFIDEAKKTTLSLFKINFRGADADSEAVDRPIMIVLLRSDDRDKDAAVLLSYVAKNIRYAQDSQE